MQPLFPQLIKCAGFGGQGILALGEIIAIAAMRAGKTVSWLPSYGPESRGGTCNCDVILSDADIAAPIVERPNVAIVFNQPSLNRFESRVRPEGVLFYDAELVSILRQRDDVVYIGVPFTKLAQAQGTVKIANMVALGAYVGALNALTIGQAIVAMKEKFAGKEAFFPLNERAIEIGANHVQPLQSA